MGVLFQSKTAIEPDYMRKKTEVEKRLKRKISRKEFEENFLDAGGGQ